MANVSGHTKKLTVTGGVFVAYCAAMIIGPQVFLAKEAPTYSTGYNSLMRFEIGAISMLALYAIGCEIENKRRDEREGTEVVLADSEMIEDKTDYEKRGFRYVYQFCARPRRAFGTAVALAKIAELAEIKL